LRCDDLLAPREDASDRILAFAEPALVSGAQNHSRELYDDPRGIDRSEVNWLKFRR